MITNNQHFDSVSLIVIWRQTHKNKKDNAQFVFCNTELLCEEDALTCMRVLCKRYII